MSKIPPKLGGLFHQFLGESLEFSQMGPQVVGLLVALARSLWGWGVWMWGGLGWWWSLWVFGVHNRGIVGGFFQRFKVL